MGLALSGVRRRRTMALCTNGAASACRPLCLTAESSQASPCPGWHPDCLPRPQPLWLALPSLYRSSSPTPSFTPTLPSGSLDAPSSHSASLAPSCICTCTAGESSRTRWYARCLCLRSRAHRLVGRTEEAFCDAAVGASFVGASGDRASLEAWDELFEAALAREDARAAGIALAELLYMNPSSPKRREQSILLQRIRKDADEKEERRQAAVAAAATADPIAKAIFADEYVIPDIDNDA